MDAKESALGPSVLSRLSGVTHVVYADDPAWLVAVQFRFAEGVLCVEADPGDDTVEVAFEPQREPVLRHWGSKSVTRNMDSHYIEMLGLDSAWRWTLHNQQGYRDGFQVEFGPANSPITQQYLVVASRLYPRRVKYMEAGQLP